MIVCVETIFVLELALGQEQAPPAEEVLVSAESGEIELAIPSFSLAEPFSTVTKRHRDRKRLANDLNAQAQELSRSTPHQHEAIVLEPLVNLLTQIGEREMDRLVNTVERVLEVATVIQIDLPVFRGAMQYRNIHGLSEQDATIYAAIVSHLAATGSGTGPHYFVSRNSKDFTTSGIRHELNQFQCTFLASFSSMADLLRPHRQLIE